MSVSATRNTRPSKTMLYVMSIILSATLLGFFNLTRDNGWGDDFAGYILQAQSIVRGNMGDLVTKNVQAVERSSGDLRPGNYPWGFPLMLAPIYAIFGVKIIGFKLVLTLCHGLLVGAVFCLARTRLNVLDSLIVAAVVAYNAVLISEGQGEVLSDVPFTLLSTVALWMMLRPASPPSAGGTDTARGIFTGLAIFGAVFIRPNGFLLFLPLAAAHLPRWQSKDAAVRRSAALAILVPAVTVASLDALQAWVFPNVSLRQVSFSLAPESLWRMLIYYLPYPAYFFRHLGPAAWIIYGIQIILVVLSLLAHWKRDLPLAVYVLCTVVMYIAFPYKQGVRYLYPIWPVLLIFTLDGMRAVAERLGPVKSSHILTVLHSVWIAIAVSSLAISTRLAWLNIANDRGEPGRTWGAFSPGSTAMFDFISDHTRADGVIIFYKPRALSLRTNRDSFLTTDCADLPKADYLVIAEDNGTYDQIAPELVQDCNPGVVLTPLYMKDRFIVYEIGQVQ